MENYKSSISKIALASLITTSVISTSVFVTPQIVIAATPINMTTINDYISSSEFTTAQAYQQRHVETLNAYRAENGLHPMKLDQHLSQFAYMKAQDMILNNYFAHNTPNVGDLVAQHQYFFNQPIDTSKYLGVGENLNKSNYNSNDKLYISDRAIEGFKTSPGHNANMLDNEYDRIGVALIVDDTNNLHLVQMFGIANPSAVEEVSTEVPTTEAPTIEEVTTELPTTEAPTTEEVTTELPTTEAPTTEEVTTELPTTEAPTTEEVTTELPTTEVPTTEEATTEAPTTEAPTTEAPTTEAPTTEAPTTEAPTTEAPTTEAPTTEVPTTEAPTTEVPTTEAPTIEEAPEPSTEVPTEQPAPEIGNMPEIKNDANDLFYLNEEFDPFEGITAKDVEDGDLTNQVELISGEVDTSVVGEYKLIYEVMDSDGNVYHFVRKVEVVDVEEPTTEVPTTESPDEGPNNIPEINVSAENIIQQHDNFDPLLGVTAYDEEDGDLTDQIELISGQVDPMTPGLYELIYGVNDVKGNKYLYTRIVEVITGEVIEEPTNEVIEQPTNEEIVSKDPIHGEVSEGPISDAAPTIKLLGDKFVVKGDTFDPLEGVTAHDKEDGDLTQAVKVVSNNVDMTTPGEYEVVYEVEDSLGNKVKLIRPIQVVKAAKEIPTETDENTVPVITVKSPREIVVGQTFDELEFVEAIDSEDGDIIDNVKVIKNNVNPNKQGVYEVVYAVEDKDGNKSQVTQIVKVVDQVKKETGKVTSKSVDKVINESIEATTTPVTSEREATNNTQVEEKQEAMTESENTVNEATSETKSSVATEEKEQEDGVLPATGENNTTATFVGLLTMLTGIAFIFFIRRENENK